MPNPDIMRLARLHKGEDSFATQRDRRYHVKMIARQLAEAGFKRLKAKGLKPKHVDALVERWKNDGISIGTFKNRMGALRWIYRKVNKHFLIARENSAYGIGRRQYVTNVNKAVSLPQGNLERVKCPYVRMSLELQREFGLRREEAIKIVVAWADRGSRLVLRGSWTKGGRPREIPIRTEAQREVLERAKVLAATTPKGSLIPTVQYKDQVRRYERQTAAAGLHKLHGLRHAYAQNRYFELTGRLAPAAPGGKPRQLPRAERPLDREARDIISDELGHGREQITALYLGR
ncbi:MAG: integrase domain-containing protein [bacterium]|nr:integrase domain-containing protein [bacterium]